MRILFCEHPKRPLNKKGYCSYYGEIFYALKEHTNLQLNFIAKSPDRISELGSNHDAIIFGFAHTDVGDGNPKSIMNDVNIPVFPILNKEYAGLNGKLNWIKSMKPTAAFTVQHEIKKYTEITGIPFHRIMWSADENLFKDYGEDYQYDLFYSGVVRSEQSEDFRKRIFNEISRLDKYNLLINARYQEKNYSGKIFSPEEYSRNIVKSKICLTTTGPADLVGTRYFEIMAGNRALIICNRLENPDIYGDMLRDGFNCVMFSTVDEFFQKAIYYLEHEEERMKIVSTAYEHFENSQTWAHRSKSIIEIIKIYIK